MATATLPMPALKARSNGTAPQHVHAPQDDTPTAQIVSVSPQMARAWLATRHGNRPLSQARVKALARAIASGKWMVNGGTLVTCSDNRLLDGQHRCAAIEASGITVQTLVVCGVDPASFPTMDQGRKRSAGDILAIGGHGRNAGTLASALRWTWRYENMMMCSTTIALNDFELLGYLCEHREIVSSVSWGLSVRSLIPSGAGAMLHTVMHGKDPALAETLFRGLASGLELRADDAIYVIREKYIHQPRAMNHMSVVERAAAFIRAWQAMRGQRSTMPQGRWAGTSATFPKVE